MTSLGGAEKSDPDGRVLRTIGMHGKRGSVTVDVHESGLYRVHKEGAVIGEYENADMALDFARQQAGYGR